MSYFQMSQLKEAYQGFEIGLHAAEILDDSESICFASAHRATALCGLTTLTIPQKQELIDELKKLQETKNPKSDELKKQINFITEFITKCSTCGKTNAKFICSRCKKKRYCSKDCQAQDYDRHKTECMVQQVEEFFICLWLTLETIHAVTATYWLIA